MNTTVSKNTVKVYTTLDKTFVEALCGKFTDSQPKEKRIVFEVLNQEKEMLQADCIIGEATLLQQKAAEGSLQKISAEYADMLPAELKGNEEKWITLFYDPAVLLVNQAYSRKVGQQQFLHWADLPKQTEARLVMENLSDNESTSVLGRTVFPHGTAGVYGIFQTDSSYDKAICKVSHHPGPYGCYRRRGYCDYKEKSYL